MELNREKNDNENATNAMKKLFLPLGKSGIFNRTVFTNDSAVGKSM